VNYFEFERNLDQAVRREAGEALLEGRDRHHRLFSRKFPDPTFWGRFTDRSTQMFCLCGWYGGADGRKHHVDEVYEDHVASEDSRPPRTRPRREYLVRLVQENMGLFMVRDIERLPFENRQTVGRLSGSIQEDYDKERLGRPRTRPVGDHEKSPVVITKSRHPDDQRTVPASPPFALWAST